MTKASKSRSILHHPLSYLTLYIALIAITLAAIRLIPLFAGVFHYLIVGVIVSCVTLWLTRTWLKHEQRNLAAIGLLWRQSIGQHAFIGLLLGCVTMLVIFASLLLSGSLEVQSLPTEVTSFLIHSVPILLVLALMEELIFRGYLMFRLRELFGTRVAVYVTALVFGLYHGWSLQSLLGPAIWGLVFALLALKSRGLAMPIMFHFALNWLQALFNMKVKYTSGLFEFTLPATEPLFKADSIGLMMQGIVLLFTVIAIERFCQQERLHQQQTATTAIG
ncbi:MAG: CPBP family intramembrane metalloprotease [Gammaproteobacteria bacterium]|nr:CPBP family intramembrane metalloprotease [Gammaproteobacteria bacterium]